MQKAFDLIPDLTEDQKELLIILGAKLYIRGCSNGMKAMLKASQMIGP
jgi:prefoldin subunit 5